MNLFFSLRGRIGRGRFWLGFAPLFVVAGVLGLVPVLGFIFSLGFMYCWVCLYGKRLHDLGRSAWWAALPMALSFAAKWTFVVGYGSIAGALNLPSAAVAVAANAAYLAAVLWVGLPKSQPGENRFGPPAGQAPAAATADTFS